MRGSYGGYTVQDIPTYLPSRAAEHDKAVEKN